MPFEIIRNDITNMRVDAIVNTANPRPVIGSGTDAAVHANAGPMLLQARKLIGSMNTGEACVTPGFRLPASYVIHTVGPVWTDGTHGEAELLRQCYRNSLKLARRHRFRSVAFPLISTGNYGFPKKLALEIAVEVIREFLAEQEMQIYLVVFSKDSFQLSEALVEHVRSFIDDAEVRQRQRTEYSFSVSRNFDLVREAFGLPEEPEEDPLPSCGAPLPSAVRPEMPQTAEDRRLPRAGSIGTPLRSPAPKKPAPKSAFDPGELTRMVKAVDAGFSETLLRLIDRSGKKDSDIYKRANVDRKLFSKLRNNPQYKPSKATAVAFAIALELDLEETRDLISRAGYALSRSSTFDIIIEYFITHERFDIYEINMMLFEFDQSLLGA